MSSVDQTFIDYDDLKKRVMEIKNHFQNLVDEKDAIEINLQENFPRKILLSNNIINPNEQNIKNPNSQISNNVNRDSTNTNQQNNTYSNSQISSTNANSHSKLEYEEKQSESDNSVNSQDSIKIEKDILYDSQLKQFDKLKFFFEENWNDDIIFPYKTPEYEGSITERQIIAYRKMIFFIQGSYLNHYEDKIKQASLNYNLPPDQLKADVEILLSAMIMRSKVLELFDKCAIEASQLNESSDEISMLQVQSDALKRQYQMYFLIDNQEFSTWNLEKLKALLELWQGCAIGASYVEYIEEDTDDFYGVYNSLLDLLETENLEITKQERDILLSILKATKNFCNR